MPRPLGMRAVLGYVAKMGSCRDPGAAQEAIGVTFAETFAKQFFALPFALRWRVHRRR